MSLTSTSWVSTFVLLCSSKNSSLYFWISVINSTLSCKYLNFSSSHLRLVNYLIWLVDYSLSRFLFQSTLPYHSELSHALPWPAYFHVASHNPYVVSSAFTAVLPFVFSPFGGISKVSQPPTFLIWQFLLSASFLGLGASSCHLSFSGCVILPLRRFPVKMIYPSSVIYLLPHPRWWVLTSLRISHWSYTEGFSLVRPWSPLSISSSLSCAAASTDIPDPLSPLLLIIHRFWQVFRVTSRILT